MASLSSTALVTFLGIQDQYPLNSDLVCQFTFKAKQEFPLKDSLAIFKLGWNNVTEYLAIKSIPTDGTPNKIYTVKFNQHILPKNTEDLFQVCYLRGQVLCGASSPFQFTENLMPTKVVCEKDQEIERLREENEILRESLKILFASSKNKGVKEIKDLIEDLKKMVLTHDSDINMLKSKITEGGEEYRKLYIEKYKVQQKYDKLKSKMLIPEVDDGIVHLDLDDLKSIPPFPSILKQ